MIIWNDLGQLRRSGPDPCAVVNEMTLLIAQRVGCAARADQESNYSGVPNVWTKINRPRASGASTTPVSL